MTHNELIGFAETVFSECIQVLEAKGRAYSGEEDALSNFKNTARDLNLTFEKAWHVFFYKHLCSLLSYINGYYDDPEPIEMRIVDLINYLILLMAYIADNNATDSGESK